MRRLLRRFLRWWYENDCRKCQHYESCAGFNIRLLRPGCEWFEEAVR